MKISDKILIKQCWKSISRICLFTSIWICKKNHTSLALSLNDLLVIKRDFFSLMENFFFLICWDSLMCLYFTFIILSYNTQFNFCWENDYLNLVQKQFIYVNTLFIHIETYEFRLLKKMLESSKKTVFIYN